MTFRTPLAAAAAATLAATALALAPAPPAVAGTYTVHSCELPDGSAASVADWVMARSTPAAASLTNACPNGPLTLQLTPGVRHAADAAATLTFSAPADTEIVSYAFSRSVRLGPLYNYWRDDLGFGSPEACVTTTTTNPCNALGDPAQPLASGNLQAADGRRLSALRLLLTCGQGDASTNVCEAANPAAALQIHRAAITLSDSFPPRFEGDPSGPLVDVRSDLTGSQTLEVNASDRGSGVQNALLEVDGGVVASRLLDANDGRCVQPYTAAKPCAARAVGQLTLDTTKLADGPHTLRVLLSDASGNVTQWGPARITVANTSCNTAPRIEGLKLTASFVARQATAQRPAVLRSSLTAAHDRSLSLQGQLVTPAGAPIAAARVCLLTAETRAGSSQVVVDSAVTNVNGSYEFTVPGGPSRSVYVVHRTPAGAVVAELTVRVKARASLRPSRSHLRNGERVRLRGRLLDGPIPPRGVLVELQAKRGAKWQTFGTTQSRRDGRYALGYRFTRTAGVQRYTMRARVAEQASYPYERGASRPIVLTVRG